MSASFLWRRGHSKNLIFGIFKHAWDHVFKKVEIFCIAAYEESPLCSNKQYNIIGGVVVDIFCLGGEVVG